jgi:hypothetical protein
MLKSISTGYSIRQTQGLRENLGRFEREWCFPANIAEMRGGPAARAKRMAFSRFNMTGVNQVKSTESSRLSMMLSLDCKRGGRPIRAGVSRAHGYDIRNETHDKDCIWGITFRLFYQMVSTIENHCPGRDIASRRPCLECA